MSSVALQELCQVWVIYLVISVSGLVKFLTESLQTTLFLRLFMASLTTIWPLCTVHAGTCFQIFRLFQKPGWKLKGRAVSVPKVWYDLLEEIRLAESVVSFNSLLKTLLSENLSCFKFSCFYMFFLFFYLFSFITWWFCALRIKVIIIMSIIMTLWPF